MRRRNVLPDCSPPALPGVNAGRSAAAGLVTETVKRMGFKAAGSPSPCSVRVTALRLRGLRRAAAPFAASMRPSAAAVSSCAANYASDSESHLVSSQKHGQRLSTGGRSLAPPLALRHTHSIFQSKPSGSFSPSSDSAQHWFSPHLCPRRRETMRAELNGEGTGYEGKGVSGDPTPANVLPGHWTHL